MRGSRRKDGPTLLRLCSRIPLLREKSGSRLWTTDRWAGSQGWAIRLGALGPLMQRPRQVKQQCSEDRHAGAKLRDKAERGGYETQGSSRFSGEGAWAGRKGKPSSRKGKRVEASQSCPTLCDPVDSTVHGILQTRTLEWGAIPSSRGSSQPRDGTQVSRIAGRFFTS